MCALTLCHTCYNYCMSYLCYKQHSNGFTLIELLVVISIIALLSSIVFATLSTARMKARDTQRVSNAQEITKALELSISSGGSYVVTGGGLTATDGAGLVSKNSTDDAAYQAKSVLAKLKEGGVYSGSQLIDPIYGKDNYYLAQCAASSTYVLYLKVEQKGLQIASSTLNAQCGGPTATGLGFNYMVGVSGVGLAAAGTGTSSGSQPSGLSRVIASVDTVGDVGSFTSLAIGSGGIPTITYQDNTNLDLKVVKCGDVTCSSGNTITTVDATGATGYYASMALDSSGFPIISYQDGTNLDLKVVRCGNATCSGGNTITTIDSVGNVGMYNSLVLGSGDIPVISYYDSTNGNLKVVQCGNSTCSSGNTITTVDSVGDVGQWTSIALSSGVPVISYHDFTNKDLKVVRCGNAACSSGNTITTVDSVGSVGMYTSISIRSDLLPVISYRDLTNQGLKIVKCGNVSCSSGNTTSMADMTGGAIQFTSLALDGSDIPIISYYDYLGDFLDVVQCGNATCASGNTTTYVDTAANVGQYTSMKLGPAGFPVISYYDQTNGDLKVVRCGDVACSAI